MAKCCDVSVIDVHQLAAVVKNRIDNVLLLDSRSFLEFNSSHVINAVNVGCAKLMKRRLQQDRLTIQDFLSHSCHWDVPSSMDIVVYDQNTCNPSCLLPDSFVSVFLQKLLPIYNSVNIVKGGFLEFQAAYPSLCEEEKRKFTPLTSLSQPCLPISDHGPTRILPFLYLGSQHDALNKEVLENHSITYELNVSTNCPKPDFIKEAHFMRIPVIDNYSEKLLPHFSKAFQFLDKVRESGGCALVHCLAGISRSATVAIAYIMQHLKMSSDEAYRYVKSKRTTISPNFNFLGQLLEFEKQLQKAKVLCPKLEHVSIQSHVCNDRNVCKEATVYSSYITKCCETDVTNDTEEWHTQSLDETSTNSHFLSANKASVSYNFSRQRKSQKLKEKDWGAKCIPVSSLKELNFTSCQCAPHTDFNKISTKPDRLQDSEPWTKMSSFVKTNFIRGESGVRPEKPNHFNFTLFDNILSECKLESFKSLRSLSSSSWSSSASRDHLRSPSLQMQDNVFDSKDYNRSDSNSTSGLGSDTSDLFDSWSEYNSNGSCDREIDTVMEDDLSAAVPMEDDDYQKHKLLELENPYEEASLYSKFDSRFREPKSPLSPSEESFSADYHVGSNFHTSFLNGKQESVERVGKLRDRTLQSPTVLNLTNEGRCDVAKSEGLYRAQSCPGILSMDSALWIPQLDDVPASTTTPNLRSRTASKCHKEKKRNRYSCSSLDYMEHGAQVGILKACPNVPSFTSSTTESVSTLSPSHRIYRHSMIEVS